MELFTRKTDQNPSSFQLYVTSLNYIIDGNIKKAIECLKQSVRIDTNNIDAYLKLGILYRHAGQPIRAFRIHRELTIRPDLTRQHRMQIFQNLVLDLKDMDDFPRALVYVDKILEIDKKSVWAWDQKIEIFERLEDWKNAFTAFKLRNDNQSSEVQLRLACYKVGEGRVLMQKQEYGNARECFKEAIRLYPQLPVSYVYMGDTYIAENDAEQALASWEQLIMEAPEQSSPVFMRFEKVTFDEGHFDDMERIYAYVIEKAPQNIKALVCLGEFHFKKGEYDKAIGMMNRVLEIDPKSLIAHRNLARYLEKQNDMIKYLDIIHKMTELMPLRLTYKCSNCKTELMEFEVRCPSCKAWGTITD